MGLTDEIKFRVAPKLKNRAERVRKLKRLPDGQLPTMSDLGREAFLQFVQAKESEHGIAPQPSNGQVAA